MSLLFSSRLLQFSMGQVSKLAVGGAIAFTISGIPAVAVAQESTLDVGLSHWAGKQFLLETDDLETDNSSQTLSALTDEEKIGLLDAVASLDDSDYDDSDKIKLLRRLAQSYHDVGAQARAVALLDRAVLIAREGESRYLLPIRIAPAYIKIGEIETAETLVVQAFSSRNYVRTDYLIDIVEAYSVTNNTELAVSMLSRVVASLEDFAARENSRVSISGIGLIAQTYARLGDDTAAVAGLSRLTALLAPAIEKAGTGRRVSGRLATTLGQLSIAQSKQGNADEAETLAVRALEIIRDGEENGYIVAEVAAAYGYIEDREVAARALSAMMPLAMSELSSGDPVGPVLALEAIASAYEQIGDMAKAEEVLAIVTENFNDSYMLGIRLGIYIEMGKVAAQEVTIQQMFDMLPLLREAGLVVSDVTAGYAGISGIVEGYVHTTDDVRAQERLAMLESFFKEVPFDPLGTPGQLSTLARAAAIREDYESAQRLLTEATQSLVANGCQANCTSVFGSLACGYTFLEDEQIKQSGFDTLQQIANASLALEERDAVSDLLIHARAVF